MIFSPRLSFWLILSSARILSFVWPGIVIHFPPDWTCPLYLLLRVTSSSPRSSKPFWHIISKPIFVTACIYESLGLSPPMNSPSANCIRRPPIFFFALVNPFTLDVSKSVPISTFIPSSSNCLIMAVRRRYFSVESPQAWTYQPLSRGLISAS